jgi:hypothetical protein
MKELYYIRLISNRTFVNSTYVHVGKSKILINNFLGINNISYIEMEGFASMFYSEDEARIFLEKYVIPSNIGNIFSIEKCYADEHYIKSLNTIILE